MSTTPKNHRRIVGVTGWLVVIGAAIGVFAGLFVAAGLTVSGVTRANLPPLAQPTATATPTPLPTTAPTPAPTSAEPKPSLTTDSERVPPGERFPLRGRIPGVAKGTSLQVQVKDGSSPWDDFPITTPARAGGKFETVIYTSRTGDRKFRLIDKASGKKTPTLHVTIG